jgi:hypothetical protein
MLALALLFVTGKRGTAEIVSSRSRLAIYVAVAVLALVPLVRISERCLRRGSECPVGRQPGRGHASSA